MWNSISSRNMGTLLVVCVMLLLGRSRGSFNLTTLTFTQSYSPLFSDFNIIRSHDDTTVSLLLNRLSGNLTYTATIKMPSKYTAGIVVAFYTSNVDTFEKNHDELDIEFLGNVQGQPWRFQTNVYGNGSVSRGREERYRLWFDPTKDPHRYSILWTPKHIIFYVDEIPIRNVVRQAGMRGDYPSKAMSVYATIWDASSWATNGGKKKVDYKYEPFVARLGDLVLEGCIVDPVDQLQSSNCTDRVAALMAKDYSTITADARKSMRWFRQRYMYYSYCYDNLRYPVPPPECILVPSERDMLTNAGRVRFSGSRRRRDRRSKPASHQPAAR
ncbi:xyloglucan endotransglucosylase/hydrolase 30 [Perilla frutescens var. hirtella]|nr:xyloglucan endotransglucosylase/hydrolase 30 [Perilla frutescens var. frutescens]KAH6792538.1 xyloglucan endotransglucosylase/hydrolase 30 [Perilla frutescens var. hirtella]